MTSLYDQYHSEKNIDHMYNLLNDLIQKQNGKSIKSDLEFKKYYDNQLREIFIQSKSENITDLNRELLRHHILYYKDKSKNEIESNITANRPILNRPTVEKNIDRDDNADVKEQFDEYLKMREIPKMTPIKTNDVKEELSFNDMMKDMNTQPTQPTQPTHPPQPTQPTHPTQHTEIKPKILEEPVIEKPKEKKNYTILTSANRTDIMSNRYNYNIKCDKDIKQLERLIIPIENTLHFTSPILKFKIVELNIDINLYLRDTYKLNNYTYGVYIPENETILNKINDNMNIQICSIYGNIEIENDIIECEIIEDKFIPKNILDFRVNDIVSINSKHFTKIIDILEDELVLENMSTFTEKLESEESIYIMNMNLQNTLVFIENEII